MGHPTRLVVVTLACAISLGAAVPVGSATTSAIGPRMSKVAVAVALGDSVPYGTHCGCTPFPELSSSAVRRITGRAVTTYNDSVSGYRTGDMLAQLYADPRVIAHVRAADIVEVEIGANDIGYSSRCGAVSSCYLPALLRAEKNTSRIVARIRSLAAGRPVAIVLLGYWNAWLDGKYAAARGRAYIEASRTLTLEQNASILSIARSTRSLYVDLWRAFRGTADSDDTELLAGDGDHPNALGHERIAGAVTAALRAHLTE